MLFRNKTIEDIKYSLSNEMNIEKFKWYKRYSKLPVKEIEAAVLAKQMS